MSRVDLDHFQAFLDQCLPALNVAGLSRERLADILFDFLTLGGKLGGVDQAEVRPLVITLADRMLSRSRGPETSR